MDRINRNNLSLNREAKAGLSSLFKQTAGVGAGLSVMLVLTGGNPPGFLVALSFIVGVGFVAWSEKKRLTEFRTKIKSSSDIINSQNTTPRRYKFIDLEMSIEEVRKAFSGDTYNQEYKLVISYKNNKANAEVASILQNYELVIRPKESETEWIMRPKKGDINSKIGFALEISKILIKLKQFYPTTTAAEQMTFAAKAIERIENNPTLKQGAISALRMGKIKEFEEAIGHPAAKIIIAVLQGWQEDP